MIATAAPSIGDELRTSADERRLRA